MVEEFDFNTLHKKIICIEEKDPDYINNPRWQKLRKMQDEKFIELAQSQLDYLNSVSENEYRTKRKQVLKKFLKDNGIEYER